MIIALIGSLCSGKETLAKLLEIQLDFKIINLYEEFARELGVPISEEVVRLFFSGMWVHYKNFMIKYRASTWTSHEDIHVKHWNYESWLDKKLCLLPLPSTSEHGKVYVCVAVR